MGSGRGGEGGNGSVSKNNIGREGGREGSHRGALSAPHPARATDRVCLCVIKRVSTRAPLCIALGRRVLVACKLTPCIGSPRYFCGMVQDWRVSNGCLNTARHGMARHGTARQGTAWHGALVRQQFGRTVGEHSTLPPHTYISPRPRGSLGTPDLSECGPKHGTKQSDVA